jgi:hypothetical protein
MSDIPVNHLNFILHLYSIICTPAFFEINCFGLLYCK